jgi:hypothetical protein
VAPIVILAVFAIALAPVKADSIPYPWKWSQLPDMDQGTDWLSTHQSYGPVVADDFMSDGRLILGFHWWGSYLDGLDPDPGTHKQFEVSFHGDVPDPEPENPLTFSQPTQSYQYQLVLAQETYYGTTAGGEKVYEYWGLLPTPWEEIEGKIYWLDIAYDVVAQSYRQWGWHESYQHWNDSAVQTSLVNPNVNPHTGPWVELEGHDMAFQILTTPEPCTLALLGAGLLGLGFKARRKKK